MSDDIPEDTNIFFCALKKSRYVTRDIIIGAAQGVIWGALISVVMMVFVIIPVLCSRYLKSLIDFIFLVPMPIYLIIIIAVAIYSYSLLWCYDRKFDNNVKKICAKYDIDPTIFENLDKYNKRVYIHFDSKYWINETVSMFNDGFVIMHKDGDCVVGSISIGWFVNKIEFFEKNNIPVTVEISFQKGHEGDGWLRDMSD